MGSRPPTLGPVTSPVSAATSARVQRPQRDMKLLLALTLLVLVLTTSGTEVVDANDAAVEAAEDVTMEAEAVTDNPGDAVVTAQDTSHEVKPENRDKCDKCLKVSFRYRHDNFCSKCVANNLLDEAEQDKLDNVVRSRHTLFSSATCPASSEPSPPSTTPSPTTAATTRSPSLEQEAQNEIDVLEMSKQQRRKLKFKKREERRKERERRRQNKKNKESNVELGPLGTFLKSIIVANTFVD